MTWVLPSSVEVRRTSTWVNCPRRTYGFYKDLKREYFSKGIDFNLNLRGNNWGLACNSIHFLDLAQWFSEKNSIKINTDFLERRVIDSKRDNFKEVFGELRGDFNGSNVALNCGKGDDITSVLEFQLNDRNIKVNETLGYMDVFTKSKNVRKVERNCR